MDAVSVRTDVDEVGRVQLREGLHFPGVSRVHGTVVQQRPVLTLVLRTAVGDGRGDADDVEDFVVQSAHRSARPEVSNRGHSVVEHGVVGQVGVLPRACAGVAAHHVKGRVDASVTDDHLTAVSKVVDGRPTDAHVFNALVRLLAPHLTVVKIVARAAVFERRHVQRHGPSCADGVSIAGHAVVDGGVRLQVVLGDPDDLTLHHQVTHLHVVGRWGVLGRNGRLGTVVDVEHGMRRHGCFHPRVGGKLRGLTQVVLLGKRGRRGQQAEREKGKLFHESGDLSPKYLPHLGEPNHPSLQDLGNVARTVSRPFTFWSRPTWMSVPSGRNTSIRDPNLMKPTSSPRTTSWPGLM